MQIAKTAIIDKSTKIGKDVIIRDFVVIYPNVEIGDGVDIMEGAVIGRLPKGTGAVSRKTIDKYKSVKIGAGSVISPHVVIYTDVQIGTNTLIGDGASIREECSVGDKCIISRCVTINYHTRIGNNTKIMDNTHITGNMIIGDNVFISIGVLTTNDNTIGKNGYSESEIIGPTILDNAMIGAGASILPKVIIGKNAIVGSGAVVTKNVQESTVVMGMPAKFVRNI